jgi:hypothetical protein
MALARGETLTAACRAAGVSLATVQEWLRRARGDDPQRPWTPAYQAFLDAVTRAQQRWVRERFAQRYRAP